MSHTPEPPSAEATLTRLAKTLQRDPEGRYVYPPSADALLARTVETAAQGEGAVGNVGAILKLIYVLRGKLGADEAAQALVRALRGSEPAMRIIALHWSGGSSEASAGPSLLPRAPKRAPHVALKDVPGAIKASAFLTPGMDQRGRRS